MSFDKLFSPIKIRGLELKNRVVMSGMGTKMIKNEHEVSEKLIGFHAARAKGGVGLNVVEVTSVEEDSAPVLFLSLGDDKYIPGHKALTDAIHEAGGKASIQLWQGGLGSYQGNPLPKKAYVVSDLDLGNGFVLPGMTKEDINYIVKSYGKAAARAVKAGYDTVEFHAAHNYLPHTFLSAGFNKRTDEYGGSLENRMRFPLECIREIRRNIPEDMPLFMRLDVFDDGLEKGLTMDEVADFIRAAEKEGVDIVNLSRGNFMIKDALIYEVPPCDVPNGYNIEPTDYIRRVSGVKTVLTGRINTPELAEWALENDKTDMVVMARAQLADPEFCNKAKAGKLTSIKYCIGCDQGCYDSFVDPEKDQITCMRNPALGHESEYEYVPVKDPKKVIIAGGGIGGIEAADFLYKRGHKPVLYEKGDSLGGQFVLAGVAPRKDDFKRAAHMAIKNIEEEGVDIRMNTEVTPEVIKEEEPDAVIIAIGSNPIIPRIPGADGENIFESHEVLAGANIPGGKGVVIGGGLVGMEVAEYLCSKGSTVTVVEMKDSILKEMGELRRIATELSLKKEPVEVMLSTTCKEIKDGKVIVTTEDGEEKTIDADYVVMAIGSKPRPHNDIEDTCKEIGIPYYVIGDALKAPRLALNAIHEAFQAAWDI